MEVLNNHRLGCLKDNCHHFWQYLYGSLCLWFSHNMLLIFTDVTQDWVIVWLSLRSDQQQHNMEKHWQLIYFIQTTALAQLKFYNPTSYE